MAVESTQINSLSLHPQPKLLRSGLTMGHTGTRTKTHVSKSAGGREYRVTSESQVFQEIGRGLEGLGRELFLARNIDH